MVILLFRSSVKQQFIDLNLINDTCLLHIQACVQIFVRLIKDWCIKTNSNGEEMVICFIRIFLLHTVYEGNLAAHHRVFVLRWCYKHPRYLVSKAS